MFSSIIRIFFFFLKNVAVESSAIVYPKHVKLEKFDIIDFPTAKISDYFNTLTDKIHTHLAINRQNKVLVHCMAGISRSKPRGMIDCVEIISSFRYNNRLCLSDALYEYVITRCLSIV